MLNYYSRWIHDYQEACVDKLERFMRGEFSANNEKTSTLHRYTGLPHGLPPTPSSTTQGIRSPSQQRRSCSVDTTRHTANTANNNES